MAATKIMAATPITTPSTVRKERVLCSRTVCSAIRAFTPHCKCFMKTVLILESQSFDRIELGGFSSWIHAEEHADRHGNSNRQDDRRDGHSHRYRRGVAHDHSQDPGHAHSHG